MMNSERGSMASQTIENENLNKDEEVLQQATQGLQLRLLMLSRRAPVATVRRACCVDKFILTTCKYCYRSRDMSFVGVLSRWQFIMLSSRSTSDGRGLI